MNKKIIRYVMIFSLIFLSGCGRTKAVVEEKTAALEGAADTAVSDERNTEEEAVSPEGSGGTLKEKNPDGSDYDNIFSVRVYVCGAVRNEGVYTLPNDSIVNDVLQMAGGYREDAYHGYVNLAASVTDGMRIYFPTEAEMEEAVQSDSDIGLSNEVFFSDTDGMDRSGTGDPIGGQTNSNGIIRININTADKAELTKLPGIGESKAEDIIRYREEHGEFKSIDDIKKINGIKDGIFEKIRDLITT